jgi:uncharacterized membrane protein YraQ (UPF0718 family)
LSLNGIWVPLALLLTLVIWVYVKQGRGAVGEGFTKTGNLFLVLAPQMAIGFLLAGFLALVIPQNQVARWIGEDSGMKGLFVASLGGILTPGGPFTHFPLLATLRAQGAGLGPLAAYITAWSLLGVHRIVLWEGPLLGWRFVLVRSAASVLFPPVTGWIVKTIVVATRHPSSLMAGPP